VAVFELLKIIDFMENLIWTTLLEYTRTIWTAGLKLMKRDIKLCWLAD